jgi:hypothetical protein
MHAVRQQHRRLFLTVWMISILGFIAILGFVAGILLALAPRIKPEQMRHPKKSTAAGNRVI